MTHLCKEDFRANPTPRVVRKRFVLPLLMLLAAFFGSCSSSDNPPVFEDNASLSSLSISGITLEPEFSPSVTDYTAAVRFPSKSALVTATTADANATVYINIDGSLVAWGSVSGSIPLDEGRNTITVNVTAEDTSTRQTYTIAIDRQSASEFEFTQTVQLMPDYSQRWDEEFWEGLRLAFAADGEFLAAGDPSRGYQPPPGDPDEGYIVYPPGAGVSYVLTQGGYSGDYWGRTTFLTNAEGGDRFGASNALSADGSTVAVGAPDEDSAATGLNGDRTDNSALDSGAVYVHVRDSAGDWTEEAYIKASNTDSYDYFGSSIALSNDGATLAVTAADDSAATGVNGDETDNSAPGSGAVYVFTRHSGGVWTQQAYLKAPGTGEDFWYFGLSVTLSGDGETLAVGGFHDGREAVYVFSRDGGNTWTQQAVVKATQSDTGDRFGSSVELSDDGSTLAVGAWGEDSLATGVYGESGKRVNPTFPGDDTGAAYVFRRDNAGNWTQQAYIKASKAWPQVYFGESISLSGDGSMLVIGSRGEDFAGTGVNGDITDNIAWNSGAVYVFTRDSSEAWAQRAYIKPPTAEPYQGFGSGVAVSGDGTKLAVAAYGDIAVIHLYEL